MAGFRPAGPPKRSDSWWSFFTHCPTVVASTWPLPCRVQAHRAWIRGPQSTGLTAVRRQTEMTGILRPFALAMVFVAAIGCGGGGDNGPLGPDGDSPISATIDGQAWSAALTPGATIAMRLEGSNILGITGTNQALRSVNLT